MDDGTYYDLIVHNNDDGEYWKDVSFDWPSLYCVTFKILYTPKPALDVLQQFVDRARNITCVHIEHEMAGKSIDMICRILANNRVRALAMEETADQPLDHLRIFKIVKRTLHKFAFAVSGRHWRDRAMSDFYASSIAEFEWLGALTLVVTKQYNPIFTQSLMMLPALQKLDISTRGIGPRRIIDRAFCTYLETCSLVTLSIHGIEHEDCTQLIQSIAKNASLMNIHIKATVMAQRSAYWTSFAPLLTICDNKHMCYIVIEHLFDSHLYVHATEIGEVVRRKAGSSKIHILFDSINEKRDLGAASIESPALIIDGDKCCPFPSLENEEHIIFQNYVFDRANPFETLPKSIRTLKLLNTVFQ